MPIIFKYIKKFFHSGYTSGRVTRVILIAISLNLFFGVLFYFAERTAQDGLTLIDSIWWAMVTMTTVGYGDFYAQTSLGRFIISYPCMLIGIGIIGYLIGVVADSMLSSFSKKRRGLVKITEKNHIIICNFPSPEKVQRLIAELQSSQRYKDSTFVLVTNEMDELPEVLNKDNIKFVQGDPMREEVLLKANILESEGVFVLASDANDPTSDAKTFSIGTQIEMMERENDLSIQTVVELVSKDNRKMMSRSKVDAIVSSDGIMDGLMVQEFLTPGVQNVVHQILTNTVGSQIYIYETNLVGRKISEVQKAIIEHPGNLQVIGVCKKNKNYLNPPKDLEIEKDDQLILLAEKRNDFIKIEKEILSK